MIFKKQIIIAAIACILTAVLCFLKFLLPISKINNFVYLILVSGLWVFIWRSLRLAFNKFGILETTFRWISVCLFFLYAQVVLGGVSILALPNSQIYGKIIAIFIIGSLSIVIIIYLKILIGIKINSYLRLFCYISIVNAIYLIACCFVLLQLFPNHIAQLLFPFFQFVYLSSALANLSLSCFFYVVAQNFDQTNLSGDGNKSQLYFRLILKKQLYIIIIASFLILLIIIKYIGPGIIINADSILSILGKSLSLTIIPVLITCVPAGIYWLFKRKLLPGFYIYIWIIWCLIFYLYIPSQLKTNSPMVPRLSKVEHNILYDLSIDEECLSTLEFFENEPARKQVVDALESLLGRNYIKLPPDVTFKREALISETDKNWDTEYWFRITEDGSNAWRSLYKNILHQKHQRLE